MGCRYIDSRDSAESARRRASGSEQQLQDVGDVEQAVGQLGDCQRVRGQRDHAQVVRRHENVPGQRREQSIGRHAPQHTSQGTYKPNVDELTVFGEVISTLFEFIYRIDLRAFSPRISEKCGLKTTFSFFKI